MNGEIITESEMKQAGIHADSLRTVIENHPATRATLEPTIAFLDSIYWKGSWR